MSNTQTQDDLSFIREMTESARQAPLLGGRFYVFWGLLGTFAYIGQWMLLTPTFGLPEWGFAVLWLGFGASASIGMPLLVRSIRNKPGQGATGNRIERLIWNAFGMSLFATAMGALAAVLFFGQSQMVWDVILAVFLTSYGAALLLTGTFAGLSWMRVPAYISIASVAVVPLLFGKPLLYLVAAILVFTVSVIPGIRLMMNEPKSLPAEDAA